MKINFNLIDKETKAIIKYDAKYFINQQRLQTKKNKNFI